MKRSLLVFFILVSVFTNLMVAQEQSLDPRIWSQSYWLKMAQLGLTEFNPNVDPPPATYLGSEIPYPLVLRGDSPDVLTSDDPNITQSENSIFVNPLDPTKVLNSNNSTNWPVTVLYGTSNYRTTNGGTSWFGTVDLPGAGANFGDPATAIDLSGRYYVGYINTGGGIGNAYSTNEGTSWTNVAITGSGSDDKNHLWVDNSPSSPYEGNLYADWTSFGTSSGIVLSRSTNSGTSWTAPVDVSVATGGIWDQGANIQTGPNGEVYAIWAIYDVNFPSDESAIGMAKSTNGGATFAPATRIITGIRGIRTQWTDFGGTIPHRVNSFPVMAVDISSGPRSGWAYVIWTNHGVPGINTGNDLDVYMIRSTDAGSSWSTPIRVNNDAIGLGKHHYEPWITCDPQTGALAVVFYDNRNTTGTTIETWVATSIDGGNTWENFRVSDVSFNLTPIPGLAGGYAGDYLGISSRAGMVYPVWADNRTGVVLTYSSPFQLATNVGWVEGTVMSGGNPVEDVDIDFTETGFIQIPGVSDAAGHYLAGAEVDTNVGTQQYTIRAQKFGYITYTNTVTLVLDDTITHNITMATAPGGTLMVHAHLGDGSGIGAAVSVLLGGEVVVTGNTDPITGDFTAPLPSGTYDVVIDPPNPYGTETRTGVMIVGNQTTMLDVLINYGGPHFAVRIDSLQIDTEGGLRDSIQFYMRNDGISSGNFRAKAILEETLANGQSQRHIIPVEVVRARTQTKTPLYPIGSLPSSIGPAPRGTNFETTNKGPVANLRLPGGSTGYSVQASFPAYFATFDFATPGTLINHGGNFPNFMGAGAFGIGDQSFTYAIDGSNLVTIDTSTAATTVIGPIAPFGGESFTGMSTDPTTGILYASSTSIVRSTLYTVDTGTGEATVVGEITNSPGNISLAVDNTGQMYAHDIVNDSFMSIDKATGEGTIIGLLGYDANFGQGMEYDPVSDQMYLAAFNNGTFQAELRVADRATGNTTLIGRLGSTAVLDQLGWLGIPGSGAPLWLSIAPTTGTVAVTDSVLMTAYFDATAPDIYNNPGNYFGEVEVTATNSTIADTLHIPARMYVARPAGARLVVDPASLDFGEVEVFSSATVSFLARNIGMTTLDITDINSDSPDFAALAPTSFSLATEDTHRVYVQFDAPSPAGTYGGTLSFTSNDPGAPTIPMIAVALGVPHLADRIDSLQMDIEGGLMDSLQFFMRNDGTEEGIFSARAIITPQERATRKTTGSVEFPVNIVSTKKAIAPGRTVEGDATIKKSLIQKTVAPKSNGMADYPRGTEGPSTGRPPRRAVGKSPIKTVNPRTLFGPGATAYTATFNLSTFFEEFASFNVETPGSFHLISPTAPNLFAGDMGPDGMFYGLDYDFLQLVTVDTSDGSVTVIGSSVPIGGESWSGLTYDFTTSSWYGQSTNISRSTLYSIDAATGTATVIGELTGMAGCIDISVDNTGQMYGYDILSDSWYSIDKNSGAATLVGLIGFDANFAQGMDFDPVSNVCYMGAYNNSVGQGELRIVDVTTGNTTLVGAFPSQEVTAMGFPGSAGGQWLSIAPTSGTVAVGDSILMTTHFDATLPDIYNNPGNYFGNIRITATDPLADTLLIPVRMYVQRPVGARLVVDPTSLDFGDVEIGTSATVSVLVRNIGLTTLDVTNVTTGSADFVVSAPTSFSLATEDTHRVYVTFNAPEMEGQYDATLSFTSNDPLAPTVPMTAMSVGVAHVAVSPGSFYFDLSSPDTSRATMTVHNTGTSSLSFEVGEGLSGLTASSRTAATLRSRQQQAHAEVQQKGQNAPGPGQPPTEGMGGPDEFGYIWIDSDEPGGPDFEWNDITGVGNPLFFGDDDNQGPFALGFDFDFYGNTYNSVRVCSNGFISFTSTSANYVNEAIPTVFDPNNAVYAFWDDLYPPAGGTVHWYDDAVNNQFIVQWTDIQHFPGGTGLYTFQVILKSSGEILTQYLSMAPPIDSETIGIENADGSVALQVVFDAAYMHDNLAILFSADIVPWMSAEPTEGTIAPGDSAAVEVRVHPAGLASGNYTANFIVSGNTPDVVTVPVVLDFTTGVSEASLIPSVFGLSQNYPNPFNPTTRIKYQLPEQSSVSLKLYNLLGQEVISLATEVQEAGYYEVVWNGRNGKGIAVGTGVYFYRFEATGTSGKKFTDLRKMLFLK